MNRALFYAAGGFLLVTALTLVALSTSLPADSGSKAVPPLLERFSSSTAAEIAAFRSNVQRLGGEVGQARSVISSVASERTPTPGTNAFTSQVIGAVRAADARREQRLRPVEQQLGVLSQQLVDLQQRATSMEIRIQDAIRELGARIAEAGKAKGGFQSVETIVALVGILCSLATLGLAVHKETRESREARLKIRELELKLMQGNAAQPIPPGA
jgi:hypothetical protein